MLSKLFKSVIDQDTAPIVICNMESEIIYMNQSTIKNYNKNLTGSNLKDCHNAKSNEKIDMVLEWFRKSKDNNIIYTYHDVKQNKDVYMVALRDDGKLIGYYEKHEYRNRENAEYYNFCR